MATDKSRSTALKLQLVHADLSGEASYKQLAAKPDINHSLLVHYIFASHQSGAWTLPPRLWDLPVFPGNRSTWTTCCR